MTSQIAVFNLTGVAVASDSVTTVTRGGETRTFTGAQKVFDLGPDHRVVAMTCGEARFMDVPYSVLVPQWRATLAGPLAHIEDYAESFTDWLVARTDLFGAERQAALLSWLVQDYYLHVRRVILGRLADIGIEGERWDSLEVVRLVDDVVSECVDSLESRLDLDDVDAAADGVYLAAQRPAVEEAFEYVFDDTPRTVDSDAILREVVPPLILRKREGWSLDSVVAFIGYGSQDTFPGHQAVDLTGLVDGRIRMRRWERAAVNVNLNSLLTPFAQSEAIDTFLRAYNRRMVSIAHDCIDSAIDEVLGLCGSGSDLESEALAQSRQQAHQRLTDEIDAWSWDSFVAPMLDTVASLPPADLARMADSLVGVQALRAHSTTVQPSVGGRIALVTITPEEGVTWLRRHVETSST